MAERESYYLVLDLDPDENNWPIIQKRIEQKQLEWSKQRLLGPPDQKRRAAGYLENLENIRTVMGNAETRASESEEAKQQLQQQLKYLDEQIDLLATTATNGSYNDDDLKLIHRQFNQFFSETEIEKRIRHFGLKRNAKAGKKTKTRQKIDATVAKRIRANLDYLSLSSLYDFLDLKPHNTPKELCRRADKIYLKLKSNNKTNTEHTTQIDLTGQCKNIFANAEEKAKYDYTLATQVLDELKPKLELAGRNNHLSQKTIDLLINQAAARSILPEDARSYIEEYATKRKWSIESTVNTRSSQRKSWWPKAAMSALALMLAGLMTTYLLFFWQPTEHFIDSTNNTTSENLPPSKTSIAQSIEAQRFFEDSWPLVNQMLQNTVSGQDKEVEELKKKIRQISRPRRTIEARQSARRLNQNGLQNIKEGAYKVAVLTLGAAHRKDSADAEIANNLGYAFLMQNKLEDARSLLFYTLGLAPGRAKGWSDLGRVFARQENSVNAKACFINTLRYSKNVEVTRKDLHELLAEEQENSALKMAIEQALAEKRDLFQ